MKITLFGFGCSKYKATEKVVESVIADNHLEAQFEKVTDFNLMKSVGIMATPALAIDGRVVCQDRIPNKDEILHWLLLK